MPRVIEILVLLTDNSLTPFGIGILTLNSLFELRLVTSTSIGIYSILEIISVKWSLPKLVNSSFKVFNFVIAVFKSSFEAFSTSLIT